MRTKSQNNKMQNSSIFIRITYWYKYLKVLTDRFKPIGAKKYIQFEVEFFFEVKFSLYNLSIILTGTDGNQKIGKKWL